MPVTRWEYHTQIVTRQVTQGFTGTSLTAWQPAIDFNALGQQGWELVSVAPVFFASCGPRGTLRR